MSSIIIMSSAASRSVSVFLGMAIMALAAGVIISGGSFNSITHQALNVFGLSFILLLSALFFTVCFCWIKMIDNKLNYTNRAVWTELADHTANGTATLALTYTLLGISLGISSLSNQELTTDTIQTVIGGLTKHFSMAFMTTVIGLPVSCLLRAVISVTETKFRANEELIQKFENPILRRSL
jgi:hypothetical protein